jgi:hypothetical protein
MPNSRKRVCCATACRWVRILQVALAISGAVPGVSTAADEHIAAVWKDQTINFYYRSSTAIYSCSALKARIISILRSVGARDDIEIDATGCDAMLSPPAQAMPSVPGRRARGDDVFRTRPSRGEQFSHVRIRLRAPIEATPEVLAELKKDKPRRELIAKVTGKPDAVIEGETQFPAEWHRIVLSRESNGLEAVECELLDQLSTTVLRDIGVRTTSRDYTCTRGEVSRIPPKMTVEALVPAALSVPTPEIIPGTQTEEKPQGNEETTTPSQEPR